MALGLAIEDAVRDVRRRHMVPDVRWDASKLSREQSLDAKWVPAGTAAVWDSRRAPPWSRDFATPRQRGRAAPRRARTDAGMHSRRVLYMYVCVCI